MEEGTEEVYTPKKDWTKVWNGSAVKKNNKKRSSPPPPLWKVNWRSPQKGEAEDKENTKVNPEKE